MFGVLPADQGLCADHLAGAQIDLGLVVQHQLVLGQGLTDALQAFMVAAHMAILLGIKDMAAVLAQQLGLVHGLIGLAQQLVGVHRIGLRVGGHPHAGRDLQAQRADQYRLGCRGQDAVDRWQPVTELTVVVQHGHELIPTQARQGVALAQGVAHAQGQGHEQLVAHFVTMPVVHLLETVEVEVKHGQAQLTLPRVCHGLLQPRAQQHPIGQACQGIVLGVVAQLLLVGFQRRDVGKQRHILPHLPLRILHGADGLHLGIVLATLAAVPQLTLPVTSVEQGAPHLGVEQTVLTAGVEQVGLAPDRLLTGVAGDAGEGFVDVDDGGVGAGDQDALTGMGEHAGGQVQALFAFLAFDGDAHQAGSLLDELDVGRLRGLRLAVVDRKAAQHLAGRRQHGLRPAGAQPGAGRQAFVQFPVRMPLDVFDDDPLAGVHRRAARAGARPDGDPIDRLVVEGRQAGGRAMPQVHPIGVQQQDAAQGGRHQLLDVAHDGVQHGRQVFSACQHFQNVAAELLELLGVFAPVDVGEGADHAQGFPLGPTLDHRPAAQHPAGLAIGAAQSVFALVVGRFLVQVGAQCRFHPRSVVRVNVR